MIDPASPPLVPLVFRPHYQVVVWGGRRMQAHRPDLPDGPVGESWDLADHDRGMSHVASGPWAGTSLRELVARYGRDLVGHGFRGGPFPLMVKLIDANDRLSVQVHPDDELARAMGCGPNGKTECWFMLEDGGELYQGLRPGVDKPAFERALAAGTVDQTLNRYACHRADFFYLPARTVHALGAGCLLYEVQQTSDVTFRVFDWGRVGLDGKPRPMHVSESLRTINFSSEFSSGLSGSPVGPVPTAFVAHPSGGTIRPLVSGAYFSLEARALGPGATTASSEDEQTGPPAAAIVIVTSGAGVLETQAGGVPLEAMHTALVPTAAGGWTFQASARGAEFLVARPRFAA